jgi:hypothetical protein
MSQLLSPTSDQMSDKSINNNNNNNKLSLEERFKQLETLLTCGPTLLDGKSINCELFCDVFIAIYNECQRFELNYFSSNFFRSNSMIWSIFKLIYFVSNYLFIYYLNNFMNRNANTTRNKQQQKFCEFVKPLIERINELQLKSSDFEQLKVIGRGAFGQVALVKVSINSFLTIIN